MTHFRAGINSIIEFPSAKLDSTSTDAETLNQCSTALFGEVLFPKFGFGSQITLIRDCIRSLMRSLIKDHSRVIGKHQSLIENKIYSHGPKSVMGTHYGNFSIFEVYKLHMRTWELNKVAIRRKT